MKMEEGMQLIDGNGKFNVEGLKDFMTATEFAQRGLSYAIVAIIGPQSSGKSTLMNHVFGTNFKMLDAYKGRGQTTKGIWIAKCNDMKPFTIAMDFEGTDSNARGEDNTAFERQSALFALTIADIILINMWYKDIGLEHAASRPLLKTAFQVMKRLFKPRKRTLLFVIRDHSKTPFEYLETALKEDIDKIWDSVAEPETSRSVVLSDFFKVEIAALSSYEFEEENFKEQVARLRQRFISPGGLTDQREAEPASGFFIRAEKIWKTIKDNKDLDLPALKVMVATVRCEEIAEEKLRQFTTDDDWLALKEDVQAGPVSGFGATLDSILETYLSQYDMEVIHFDQDVRNSKRQQMESQALEVVRNAYDTMLEHLYSNTLESFKTSLEQLLNGGEGFVASARTCAQSCFLQFDEGCEDAFIRLSGWNVSGVREKLSRHMLSEMMAKYVKQFTDVLADEVQSLFEAGEADTWVSVRNLLASKTDVAESELSNAHVDFELPRSEIDTRLGYLKENARSVVERKARESAATRRVLMRMKDRFAKVFNHDENSKSGAWTAEQNIEEIERNALSASLKILEIMAAIRLDQTTDQIEHVLFSSLMDGNGAVPASGAPPDLLTSNAWEEVSPNATLLTPVECKSLWMQFKADIKYIMNQATSTQQTLRQAKRAITIVVGVVVVVGAAVVATVGTPTAMGIAARPEVAAVLKAVGPGLAAVMKDIGPEVLVTLKDIGPEVAGAVRSLGPQIVTAVIAMMTNGFARPHQQ
ncbi:protein ROOT HAIR DEFECTIVE 3 homolog 2-like isoform X1 [Populus nigra]|uniref:protein ROOT HAIR DEFECTIVE 3 homolog 2-like isoform X1 n=1 Tax=Populus nigra TaxID=3691 RepID=UPI002B273B8E|nr:protein ROOT HAIR DEFECTIVE 3 homolog 2-like isoform X1 [Populus nigra]